MARAQLETVTREFLADWLAWTERGAPNFKPYSRGAGLCASVFHFTTDKELADIIRYDLDVAFRAEFDDNCYPFGHKAFRKGSSSYAQHLDLNRLAWVKENLP